MNDSERIELIDALLDEALHHIEETKTCRLNGNYLRMTYHIGSSEALYDEAVRQIEKLQNESA
jgi:hypothetical protein